MRVNKISLGLMPLATTKTNVENFGCTKPLPFDSVSFGKNIQKLNEVIFLKYNNTPIPQQIETIIDKDTNKIISKTFFQQDGKTKISEEIYYPELGKVKEKSFYDYNGDKINFIFEYDKNGNHIATKNFDYNKHRYFRTLFSGGHNKEVSRIESYDLRNNQLKAAKIYMNGIVRNLNLYNPDKTLKKQIVFYADGKTPRIQYEFSKDEDLVKITYMNLDGSIESVVKN